MKKTKYIFYIFGGLALLGIVLSFFLSGITPKAEEAMDYGNQGHYEITQTGDMINLPHPIKKGEMSLEEALTLRRSTRSYSDEALELKDVSQLLWSAQGITNDRGFRTAPSAGATFPLELYIVANNVKGLPKGIYHYILEENSLETIHLNDISSQLATASLSQSMLSDGALVIVFGAIPERTEVRYGDRTMRYIYNEVGHASQNVHLQAAAMNLGTVVIGAYRDDEVERILNLDDEIRVLYMMPVGRLH